MRLKITTAKTVSDAMDEIRKELGPNALIIDKKKLRNGDVEITAALDVEENEINRDPHEKLSFLSSNTSVLHPFFSNTQSDYDVLKWHNVPDFVLERLTITGSLKKLMSECLFFPIRNLVDNCPIVLSGMAGAGKTTVAIRLAVRSVISGVKPVIINADNRRAGANHQILTYGRLLGINVACIENPVDIESYIRTLDPNQPVIVDTSAVSGNKQTCSIKKTLEIVNNVKGALVHVASAGVDSIESLDIAQMFLDSGSRHTVVTRLDCHRRLGGVIAMAVAGIPISELTVSDAVAGGGIMATEECLYNVITKQAFPDLPQYTDPAEECSRSYKKLNASELGSQRGAALLAQHISAQRKN